MNSAIRQDLICAVMLMGLAVWAGSIRWGECEWFEVMGCVALFIFGAALMGLRINHIRIERSKNE